LVKNSTKLPSYQSKIILSWIRLSKTTTVRIGKENIKTLVSHLFRVKVQVAFNTSCLAWINYPSISFETCINKEKMINYKAKIHFNYTMKSKQYTFSSAINKRDDCCLIYATIRVVFQAAMLKGKRENIN